jgi:hypothetical protein
MPTNKHIPLQNSIRTAVTIGATCLASAILFAGVASAQPAGGGDAGGRARGGPPPEALAACKSLSSGKECMFNGRSGEVKGICFAPEGKALSCRPKEAPQQGGQMPPAK